MPADHVGEDAVRRVRTQLGELLRNLIDISVAQGSTLAQEWTGWALLAATSAQQIYENELPHPARTAAPALSRTLAFTACNTGRALIIATAVDLIDVAELAA